MIEIELNGAADNPVFFPDEELVLTGANFQGMPMAFAARAPRHGRDDRSPSSPSGGTTA